MRRSSGCRPIAIALSALLASGLVAPAPAHAQQAPGSPAPAPAHAQQAPGSPAPAPAHAQQAPAAAATDDTAEVCFSAAERAQPLLRQKKLREARAVLELCTREACPRVARTDCREWLAEATDAQPSIVIAAHEIRGDEPPRDVGQDVGSVRMIIDDALVVDRVDATPIVIDPGHHRLRLERAGVDPIFQDIDIRDGEKGRVVDVYWRVSAAVVPTRPVPSSVFVLGAVGILAVGVGTYFEISGLSQRHILDTSCKATATCTDSQVSDARTQLRVGDVAVGGGLLFLATATVLFLTRPAAQPAPERDPSAWITAVPGGFVGGARGNL
jgi:hypothetical protein